MTQRWRPEEDHALRRLYPQGAPIREIARQLRRSEDAVSERRRTLQMPARPRSRAWSQAEDDLLRAASATGLPAEVLASRLRRPPEQVRRRRRTLLGTTTTPRAYTQTDDDTIRAHWQHDVDLQQLARALGRSPGSLRLRAQKLGCYQPTPRRRSSKHEDATVRDGYELGLTCAQIALELRGRTASAVAARAAKLGLASYARIWTPDDDRALRLLAREGAELERAARLLARTPDALRARARKLGLAPLCSHRSRQAPRRWTSAQDEQLRYMPASTPPCSPSSSIAPPTRSPGGCAYSDCGKRASAPRITSCLPAPASHPVSSRPSSENSEPAARAVDSRSHAGWDANPQRSPPSPAASSRRRKRTSANTDSAPR